MAKPEGLTLKDIIDAQQKNAARGDVFAARSLERLTAMQKSIDEQEKIAKHDQLMQAVQTVESIKSTKDEDQLVESIEKLESETKKGLLAKTGDGLNANVIRLTDELRKAMRPKLTTVTTPAPIAPPVIQPAQQAQNQPATVKQARPVYQPPNPQLRAQETARQTEYLNKPYIPGTKDFLKEKFSFQMPKAGSGAKGWTEALKGSVRDTFKLKNLIDMGEGKNMGGLLGGQLRRTVERDQFGEDQVAMGATKNTELGKKRYDKVNEIRGRAAEANQELERLKATGATPEQIKKTGIMDKIDKANRDIAVADPLERQRRISASQRPTDKFAAAAPIAPAAVINPVAKATQGLVGSEEITDENNKMIADQLGLLKQIEENTRALKPTGASGNNPPAAQPAQPVAEEGGSLLGDIASSAGDLLGKGKKGAGKAVGALGKVGSVAKGFLSKAALPLAAGMALYDGVTGYNNANENLGIEGREATMGEKLSSAGGSILSGISFGTLDQKTASQGVANFFGAGPGKISPTATPLVPIPQAADTIAAKSAENAGAAAPSVNAPTTIINNNSSSSVNQTQQYVTKGPARNTDSTYREYSRARFA